VLPFSEKAFVLPCVGWDAKVDAKLMYGMTYLTLSWPLAVAHAPWLPFNWVMIAFGLNTRILDVLSFKMRIMVDQNACRAKQNAERLHGSKFREMNSPVAQQYPISEHCAVTLNSTQ